MLVLAGAIFTSLKTGLNGIKRRRHFND
jgi:hypothetical protein